MNNNNNTTTTMTTTSCSHLNCYLEEKVYLSNSNNNEQLSAANTTSSIDNNIDSSNLKAILESVKQIRNNHESEEDEEDASAHNQPILLENLICNVLNCTNSLLHLHMCLFCSYIGCKYHIKRHFFQNNHALAIDLQYGAIYCFICNDYQYNEKLEDFLIKFFLRNKLLRFGKFTDWESSLTNIRTINKRLENDYKIRRLDCLSSIGLRGLLNLGNTCFMNCILQALTHTPMLRDYFLSDLHVCSNLTLKNHNEKSMYKCHKLYSNVKNDCLVCELSTLYQEVYSGKQLPYIPFNLLHLIWTQVKHLAGYEQQDAHEFFIATLNSIHKNCVDNGKTGLGINNETNHSQCTSCNCIIDRIFTGVLQSDLYCSNCCNVSSKVEPFWDISLDIGSENKLNVASKPPAVNDVESSCTLEYCLKRFTQLETLTNFNCSFCRNINGATKQLTLKKLPVVACFHLKRFEHSLKLHKKILTHISFPEILDLTPYMSSERKTTSNDFWHVKKQNNRYQLFAVVNHHGTIEGGHYTCFIRLTKDQWFKCDDHIVSKASIDQVLNSEGYLLFYHKIWLDYDT